ncbi:MAG: OmpA family protein [Acetobacter sp.]|nr:OmpA family protein [Acetobacter sp.]
MDYIPANKCYLIQGTTINGTYYTATQILDSLYNSPAVDYNGYDQPPFAYTPNGETHAINPDPGTYATTLDNIVESRHRFAPAANGGKNAANAAGLNVLKPIPLYTNHQGTDESYGGFFNVLYDFDLERLFGVKSIVTPFIGGGAGYLWQRYNRPSSNTIIPYMGGIANPMIGAITGTHGGFSWQGIAGVAFDTGISGLQITAQYRMIGQPGSFYNGSFNYGTEGGHANFDQRFNHQFIVGFRYAFHNQPVHITPPSPSLPAALAAAAAPAPVPARSYLVFFDWNQYALTSRARQIVVEAAHATTYVHTTRINVNGYTDSSAAPGPAGQKYNYALSVKRARSVEAELIRNGVPASEIVIRGYGDTNPLVPTAPNTREPQNRRVEIILHA